MSLLPPRFQEPLMAGPLGPVIKPKPEVPELHVHDWRPVAGSKDHVRCSCGDVALREMVMPPDASLQDDGRVPDWSGWDVASKPDTTAVARVRRAGLGREIAELWEARIAQARIDARLDSLAPVVLDTDKLPPDIGPLDLNPGAVFEAPKVTHSDSALEVLKRREQAEENERRWRQALFSRFAVDLSKAIR